MQELSGLGTFAVVGAGGHGRELYWALIAMLKATGGCADQVLGFVDDAKPDAAMLERIGSRWLGPVARVGEFDADVVVGIGVPATRAKVAGVVVASGRSFVDVLHPSVLIGPDVRWRTGFVACANASVTTNVRFGEHVHLNRHVTIGHDCDLGDFVSVHPAATLSGNVRVGARTMVGAGAIVLPGVVIGADVQVGAGAVVTRNVPDGVTVVGAPAKRIS